MADWTEFEAENRRNVEERHCRIGEVRRPLTNETAMELFQGVASWFRADYSIRDIPDAGR